MSSHAHSTQHHHTYHGIRYYVTPFLRLILVACVTIILLLMVLILDTVIQLVALQTMGKSPEQQQRQQQTVVRETPTTQWTMYQNSSWPFSLQYPQSTSNGELQIMFDAEQVELVGFPKVAQHFSVGYKDQQTLPLRVYTFKSQLSAEEWWSTIGEVSFTEHQRQLYEIYKQDIPFTPPQYSKEAVTLDEKDALRISVSSPQSPEKFQEFITMASQNGVIYFFYQPNQSAENSDVIISNDILSTLRWNE
jgi:hypothetical protein